MKISKILAIDDKQDNLLSISSLLKNHIPDCKVLTAQTGAEGIEKAKAEQPDTILLDIHMPGMDGFEACKIIKSDAATKHIPLIMLTAVRTDTESRITGLELGADAFLTKPIDGPELAAQVTAMLRIKKAEDLLQQKNDELQQAHDDLEKRVAERTAKLQQKTHALDESDKELRESGERFRRAFIEAPFPIMIHAEDGNVLQINKTWAALTGYTINDIPTISDWTNKAFGKRRESAKKDIEKLYGRNKRVYEGAYTVKTSSGATIIWDFSSAPLGMLSDGTRIAISMAMDITERKRTEEKIKSQQQQLIQADKMVSLGTLVSGVAHEINNPITNVMLNAPILEKTWDSIGFILDDYFQKNGDFQLGSIPYSRMRLMMPKLLSNITGGARRVKEIIDGLKDYARLQTADLTQQVDVNQVVRSSIVLLENQIKKITQNFSVEYGAGLPRVQGNFQRLEQVVINLIQNACQAIPEIQRGIFISTCFDKETDSIVIKVRDEGNGISKENLAHIMDPFFTTNRDSGGTGLGLSISAGIVQDHGGRIAVQSSVGQGSTFTIILPQERVTKA